MIKNNKAFSMVELMFVMIVMGSLAAIAIPGLQSSRIAATMTAGVSDTRNLINLLTGETIFWDGGNAGAYNELDLPWQSYDSDNDGFLDDGSGTNFELPLTGKKIPWSKNIYISAWGISCDPDETSVCNDGYTLHIIIREEGISSPEVARLEYNSCTDGTIRRTFDN